MNYILAGETFTSQDAIKRRISAILVSHKIGQVLSSQEFDIVRALLDRHPDARQKIGSGVKSIYVGSNEWPGQKCFHVIRADGSDTDFSYILCIKGRDRSDYENFTEACRSAIVDQVLDVRGNLSGVDVHHERQFAEIVTNFIKTFGIDLKNMKYREGDGISKRQFLDASTASLFALFHKRHAKLIAIPKDEHREKLVLRFR